MEIQERNPCNGPYLWPAIQDTISNKIQGLYWWWWCQTIVHMWLLGKWILWPAFIIQQLQLWHGYIQLSPTAGNSTGVYVVSFSDLTWLIHSISLCSSNKQTIRNILSIIWVNCARSICIGELGGTVCIQVTRNWQIFVIKYLPESIILCCHHEMRSRYWHEVHHTLVTWHRHLVTTLVHGERLGHHQRPVHRRVELHQLLQLLDAAGSC